MENTPYLYDTLVQVLRQHRNWLDLRHLKTSAWMMVGLVHSGSVSLCAWTPFVISGAQYSQSTVRRFRRWLDNDKIEVHALYGPLIQQALVGWVDKTLYVALDTSMLWDTYCTVRLSGIYCGRAVPPVWSVIAHGSATVAYEVYNALLDRVATVLPFSCRVVFLADRGFADTKLMRPLKQMGWHFRIRITANLWIEHRGQRRLQVRDISLAPGHARCWHRVKVTAQHFGPVHLAVARPLGHNDYWYVISDEPTEVKALEEYGLRFDIEETFLDDKSNGFQLESSLIRSTKAVERLCLVLAMTTLYLVAQGTLVVQRGKRRLVDPHWFRGTSYLKIGWKWVRYALSRGYELISSVSLSSERDPEPAIASRKQDQQRQGRFVFEYQDAA
jgi:DDE family transposase